jgi:hypothetical protein
MNARQIAHIFDKHFTDVWRRGSGNPVLEQGWLEQWWTEDSADEPEGEPVAISVLAAAGAGIRWRETERELIGYVPTRPGGCYRIPRREAERLLSPPMAA